MGHSVADDLLLVVGEHPNEPAAWGHALGARTGRRGVLPGARQHGAASSALVAPSLLLTTRRVAADAAGSRGRTAAVHVPVRAAGFRVALDPDHAFVTSPVLGWTLVGVEDRGLPTLRLGALAGLVLQGGEDDTERWVDRARIVADLDRRLAVLGGRGAWLRRQLGL